MLMILSGIKPNGLILMTKWSDIEYFTRGYLGILQYESYEMGQLMNFWNKEFTDFKTLNESY